MGALIESALTALPGIITAFRSNHAAANPGEPEPTEEQVLRALLVAVTSSIAKDDTWLGAHPPADT